MNERPSRASLACQGGAGGILSDVGLNKAIHRLPAVSVSDTDTQDLPGAGQRRDSTGRAETLQDLDELA